MILVSLVLLLLLNVSPLFAASPEYDITAAYQEEEHRIYGSEKIVFVNDGAAPLSELYLFLYPNLFLEKDPDVDPALYKRAYPVAFNPGESQITSIQDTTGVSLPYSPDFFKKRILMKVQLPAPIPPQGSFEFLVHFVTTVPQKFGVFGYYRDLVTLQGGWHPYLPPFVDGKWNFLLAPPKSRFRVHLTLGDPLQLAASAEARLEKTEADRRTFLLEAEALPFFSLWIGRSVIRKEETAGNVTIRYDARRRDKAYAERTIRIAKEAASFFLERFGPLPPTVLQLVESHLYQDLTAAGSGILYLDARLFKVFPLLKRFHEASVAKGVFLLLWQERLPWEEAWVIEGLASLEAERFMRDKYGRISSLEQWLGPFSFIPVVDQVLYSKNLPLRQIYFKESIAPITNEDIQFFNHSRPEGTALFSKIKNLLGHSIFDETTALYLNRLQEGESPSFRRTLYQRSGEDLDWFFTQWLTANPALDFGIEKIRSKKVDGSYETTIVVKKHGEGVEPLEILAYERDGATIPLVWEGKGESHEEVLITPSPIDVVELDPDAESSDPNKLNNRVPRLWKVLVNQLRVGHDFQTGVTSYSAGLLFQPVYDDRHRIGLNFTHSDQGNSGKIEYSHIFLQNHTVTVGTTYERPQAGQGKPAEPSAGTVHLAYSVNYPEVPLFARYIQQITGQYPNFNVTTEYDQRVTGNEYDRLVKGQVDLRRFYAFSNYHEIGGRVFLGESFGDLFKSSRFFLGGDNGMRGYTPLRFEGDNIALFSVEYRVPVFYETDLNLAGLALTHTLQGALFADTGNVANTANLLHFVHYKSDVGAGLRWSADSFGFYPILFRFDVAVPIHSHVAQERKPHYYLTAGQSF